MTILDYVKSGKSLSEFSDGKKIRTEHWPIEFFLNLDPFIKNRPVDRRVKKKKEELKKKFLLTHLEVKIGRAIKNFGPYKKGDIYIADGNTRCMVWSKYPELRPNLPLSVTIMDFETVEDSEATYYSIDSATSVETSSDKIGGFFRSVNFVPVSKKLKEGKITTTILDATKYVLYFNGIPAKETDIIMKTNYHLNELYFLDSSLDYIKNLSSNLFSCLIMIVKKHGQNNKRVNELIMHLKDGTFELNDKFKCDGIYYVMVCLLTSNPDKWYITGHKKAPELLYEMLYSLDMFIQNIPLKKKKTYVVSKNQKHREFFQNYFEQ